VTARFRVAKKAFIALLFAAGLRLGYVVEVRVVDAGPAAVRTWTAITNRVYKCNARERVKAARKTTTSGWSSTIIVAFILVVIVVVVGMIAELR
jgi:hypothetical protein